MYYFSIWHINLSSVNLAAVCRDCLGRHRANLGAGGTLRSLPCAGEPEESLGCGQTHSRASTARLQSQSTAAHDIFLYHSPYHWNSFVHLGSRTEKHFLMLPKDDRRKLSEFPVLVPQRQGRVLIHVSLCLVFCPSLVPLTCVCLQSSVGRHNSAMKTPHRAALEIMQRGSKWNGSWETWSTGLGVKSKYSTPGCHQ